MMIGGEADVVKRLDPIFKRLAPGMGDIARTPGRKNSTVPRNWVICTAGQTGPAIS